MLFHFLNFSQCVVCMFGHKKTYKVTNLKVYSKGRYLVFKKSLFKNYNEWLVWTTKLFSCICDVTKNKSRIQKFEWWGVGRTLGWALHVSKSKPGAGVFISLYFWWKPTIFRNDGCHFHFILHVMSDKAVFVSSALCTALPGKPRSVPLQQRLPLAEN